MNMNDVTEQMSNTHLNDEQLLFRPASQLGIPESVFAQIPRFLFRIVSPHSDGVVNDKWMFSQAASVKAPFSSEDIFFQLDAKKPEMADMLSGHLWWKRKRWPKDNLVSWTSSLLFALQYIYYKHSQKSDGSNLEDIKLYVIDTTLFPRGTFMRDLDLIDAFAAFDDNDADQNLASLSTLRRRGDYYFGEYLSQGALKIEGKYQVLPAGLLFTGGRLRRLQPALRRIEGLQRSIRKPTWANEVRDLRATIWTNNPSSRLSAEEMRERMVALGEMVDNFDPPWRFPMAIYFAGLIGPQSEIQDPATNDNAFFLYFKPDHWRRSMVSGASGFELVAPDSMPELKRVEQIYHEVWFYQMQLSVLAHLRTTALRIRKMKQIYAFLTEENTLNAADGISILAGGTYMIKTKLADIQTLCEQAPWALGVEGE